MGASSLDLAKRGIKDFLQTFGGEPFDKCDVLFQMISAVDPDQQSELFQYLCEIYGTIKPLEKETVPISVYSAQKDRLEEQYGDIVNSIIKTYSQQNNDEQVFYQTVWTLISESILFDTNAKRIFALYYILIDKRIPYFKIDESTLYSMSNDRFSELLHRSAREGQRIRYILKSDFSQKTQKASVLLNELGISLPASDDQEEINSYEIRLMQMVYILREMESDRLTSLLTRLGH